MLDVGMQGRRHQSPSANHPPPIILHHSSPTPPQTLQPLLQPSRTQIHTPKRTGNVIVGNHLALHHHLGVPLAKVAILLGRQPQLRLLLLLTASCADGGGNWVFIGISDFVSPIRALYGSMTPAHQPSCPGRLEPDDPPAFNSFDATRRRICTARLALNAGNGAGSALSRDQRCRGLIRTVPAPRPDHAVALLESGCGGREAQGRWTLR